MSSKDASAAPDSAAPGEPGWPVLALGTPEELAAQAGKGKTLDDAFTHFTGSGLSESGEQGGQFRDVARTRRTARRLG